MGGGSGTTTTPLARAPVPASGLCLGHGQSQHHQRTQLQAPAVWWVLCRGRSSALGSGRKRGQHRQPPWRKQLHPREDLLPAAAEVSRGLLLAAGGWLWQVLEPNVPCLSLRGVALQKTGLSCRNRTSKKHTFHSMVTISQDEWLHVFILFSMVLRVKPKASGSLSKCSPIEPGPSPSLGRKSQRLYHRLTTQTPPSVEL